MDNSIIFTSSVQIGQSLGLSSVALSWVSSAYTLTFGGFLLLSGRLSDLLGRKRILLIGLTIFGISSLLIGISNTPELVIGMRAIQGIGSSIIAPTSLALIMDAYKNNMRQRAISYYGATAGIGSSVGLLGFGVYQIPLDETAEAVYQAIKAGYRLIDTAAIYGNEKETGEGIKRAITEGIVSREELFVTSKLFILQAPEEKAAETIEHSLIVMELDYLDLYLIHQPYGDTYGAWRAMVAAQKAGKLRAIGVSNFKSAKMIEFVGLNDVKPQINQIEVNPWNQRIEDQEWHEKYGVQVEAWAPFAEGHHDLFANPVLAEIGKQYDKSVGQVVLRWLMQRGIVALAKSVRAERMAENIDIFDFELSASDIEKISRLDMKESAFFDHDAPQQVEWFMNRMLDIEKE